MAEVFENSGYPDQTPHSVASDLGLHYLPITLLGVSWLKWVNFEHTTKFCLLHHCSRELLMITYKLCSYVACWKKKNIICSNGYWK